MRSVLLKSLVVMTLMFSSLISASGIIEMAVYKIKQNSSEGFLTAREKTMEAIKKYPGFQAAFTYQSVDDNRQIVDYVIWDNYEDAASAARMVMRDNEALDMMKSIESIQFYGHSEYLSAITDPNDIKELNKNQRLWFRIYKHDVQDIDKQKLSYLSSASCHSNNEIIFSGRSQFINERTDIVPTAMLKGESRQYFMDFVQINTDKSIDHLDLDCSAKNAEPETTISVIEHLFSAYGKPFIK